MELCSMLCGSQDGRGVWGRRDTCTCMAETLPCSHEIISTLLMSSTPIQNVTKKKKKKLVEIRMKMSLDRRNLTREGLLSCRFSPEGTQKSMQKKELQRNEP